MPALQDFYDQHGDDVAVLGIDVENYPEAAISFAEIVGATYPQLADPGGYVFDQAELGLKQAFPQTLRRRRRRRSWSPRRPASSAPRARSTSSSPTRSAR